MTEPVAALTSRAARLLMVAAQGLARRPRRAQGADDVLRAVRRMGALQIDSIHVVARSPYLVLWSRLGEYEPQWLDGLLEQGRIFEYWAHEASFLPTEDYALYRHRMLDPRSMQWKYSHAYLQKHAAEVERVRARIRSEGPVRSADFERARRGDGWWDWKVEKRILEYLLTAGELMVARRERFQRVYDLRERVLPGWSDAQLPPVAEALRSLTLRAVRALGVARAGWVADYFRMPKRETPLRVRALAEEGRLLRVGVEGWDEDGYVHPDNGELLEAAAAGRLRATHTTLLSPFDPLVWDRARTRQVFGFDYRIECYTPAPKRKYGYFVLPILRRGELVGRLDAKAHRPEGRFEVRSLYLEPGVRWGAGLVRDVARALEACARWHRTPELTITASEPAEFGRALRAEVVVG